MNVYRAEVLGRVPHGLTHNDVFASFQSLMQESDAKAVVTKRRLAGNFVSLIVTFDSKDIVSARVSLHKAKMGILGFSADTISVRDMGKS